MYYSYFLAGLCKTNLKCRSLSQILHYGNMLVMYDHAGSLGGDSYKQQLHV